MFDTPSSKGVRRHLVSCRVGSGTVQGNHCCVLLLLYLSIAVSALSGSLASTGNAMALKFAHPRVAPTLHVGMAGRMQWRCAQPTGVRLPGPKAAQFGS